MLYEIARRALGGPEGTAGFVFRHADGRSYGQPLHPTAIEVAQIAFAALRQLGLKDEEVRAPIAAVQQAGAPEQLEDFLRAALRDQWPCHRYRAKCVAVATRRPFIAVAAWLLSSACACSPSQRSEVGASPGHTLSSATSETATVAPSSSAPPALPKEPGIYYSFHVAADLSSVSTDVCFVGPRPTRLIASIEDAAPLLRSASANGEQLAIVDGAFGLASIADQGCVRYVVDTASALKKGSMNDGASFVGTDALLSPDWWLWVPEGDAPLAAFGRFEIPGPLHVDLPWPRESRGAYDRRILPTAFIWKTQGAFVKRSSKALVVGGATLDVTVLGAGFGDRDAAVAGWLAQSAKSVSGLLGKFPIPRAQVLLVSDPNRRSSFGYAVRGGGASATVLLPARPSGDELAGDWTAVHELLHFSLPPMMTAEAWLYEGLTTYLTALARARSGMTSARYGWWELLDGFERGSKVGTGQTLREECKAMHKNRTYWRVYWSGAFMSLKMDVELRRRGQTLEALIAKLAASAVDQTYMWTAEEIVKRLDKLCGCDIPSRVTADYLDDAKFPLSGAIAKSLGVRVTADKSVLYDERAPDAAIRRAIMGGD